MLFGVSGLVWFGLVWHGVVWYTRDGVALPYHAIPQIRTLTRTQCTALYKPTPRPGPHPCEGVVGVGPRVAVITG